MPLLNDQIRHDVGEMLRAVKQPVKLTVFTDEERCDYCEETRNLIEEISSLSDQLSFETYDRHEHPEVASAFGIDKAPAVAITGAKDYGIRLYGIPSGYEFGSLLEAIKMVAEGESGLAPATRQTVAKLKDPVHIQVFTTPT